MKLKRQYLALALSTFIIVNAAATAAAAAAARSAAAPSARAVSGPKSPLVQVFRAVAAALPAPAAKSTAAKALPAPSASLPLPARPATVSGSTATTTTTSSSSSSSSKPVVHPVLTTPLGAVALMPGMKPIAPPASAAEQMKQLFAMLQTPEEVVRNSALVPVPVALQASLAKLAGAALDTARAVALPADVQTELVKHLRAAAAAGAGAGGGGGGGSNASGGRAAGANGSSGSSGSGGDVNGAGGQNMLVPAGSTGMVVSPAIQALLRAGLG